MADQLCTTAQVKARLQSSAGGVVFTAADDTLISEVIDQASSWIEHYTGRKFVAEVGATYVFDTMPGYVLRIPRGIRTVTSMGVNNTIHQPDSSGTYTTIPAADRLLRPKAADLPIDWPSTEVWLSRGTLTGTISSFGRIDNGCTITGDFGFLTTPPDIQGVALDLSVAAYQNRKSTMGGTIGADDIGIPLSAEFFSHRTPQRNTLDRYRFQSIA